MGLFLKFEAENDNYDLDPLVDDPKPTSTGLNHFVEAPITSRLVEANGIDGREVKAFPQPMTSTTDFATEKDLSSTPLSAKVDTSIIGGCNTLKRKAETTGQGPNYLSSIAYLFNKLQKSHFSHLTTTQRENLTRVTQRLYSENVHPKRQDPDLLRVAQVCRIAKYVLEA